MSKIKEFRSKIEEIFEMDKTELDFGLYKIIAQKRKAIEEFLKGLEDEVKSSLNSITDIDRDKKEKELNKLIEEIKELGYDPTNNPKVIKLKEEIDDSIDITSIENDIFSHLTNFFSRYYHEGDFISQRRYKDGVYAFPYSGEEVKLHWANHDQYYIKTSENFNNYVIKKDNKVIRLKVINATTSKDNNKDKGKNRAFYLINDNPIEIINDELIIKFEYDFTKEKQKKLNEITLETIYESDIVKENKEFFSIITEKFPTDKNKKRTFLEKELNNYTAKNSFDYFIHKDLGGFLKRELDFYIKNEVMFLDDLDEKNIKKSLSKIKAIKNIGEKIIKMLKQMEDFQKKLWEKKKFIIETNYCLTIDNIFNFEDKKEVEFLINEILGDQKQIDEWREMYGFDLNQVSDNKKDLFSDKSEKSPFEKLKNNDKLVIDTKYFSFSFKERLISNIDDLDEKIDGVLINSDNFHGLSLLQERYREKIKTIYIDPPYNTGGDGFIYKDRYQHSSWMSFMFDRLSLGRELLSDDGVQFSSIDDNEQHYLKLIEEYVFEKNNFIAELVWEKKKKGTFLSNSLTNIKEYIIVFSNNKSKFKGLIGEIKRDIETYPCINASNKRELRFIPKGIKSKYRKSDYFLEKGSEISVTTMSLKLHSNLVIKNKILVEDLIIEGNWRYTQENMEKFAIEDNLYITQDLYLRRIVKDARYKTLKDLLPRLGTNYDLKYEYLNHNNLFEDGWGSNEDGEEELRFLFDRKDLFGYPKPTKLIKKVFISVRDKSSIILDYFAGSGTTGHAVINLNREDGGKRKYILMEMGEYFNTVTKPRIKKVIYSKDWKDGLPKADKEGNLNGVTQIFKYFSLESYEDTLNNLFIKKPSFDFDEKFKEDYTLNYMMDFETQDSPSLLNIDYFVNPFEYKMNIIEDNEIKSKNIDIIETFNYIIGLEVEKNIKTRYFNYIYNDKKLKDNKKREISLKEVFDNSGLYKIKEIVGKTRDGERVLIIWRNRTDDKAMDNLIIEKYFRKQRYSVKDSEFDKIFINGDNTLPNIKSSTENWKVELIEERFKKMMFNERGL